MKRIIIITFAFSSLAALSTPVYADGYGEAAVSGAISGIISGVIQSAAKPRPVVVNQPTRVVHETRVVRQTRVVHVHDKAAAPGAKTMTASSQSSQSAGGRISN